MTRDEMINSPVTLDGEPARIRGLYRDFALVYRADNKGGDVEFSWSAVEHVIKHKDGAFRS